MDRKTIKTIAKIFVGISTSWTVNNIISNNTTPTKKIQKVESLVSGAVIGMMVSEMSEKWIDKKIDAVGDWWNEFNNI